MANDKVAGLKEKAQLDTAKLKQLNTRIRDLEHQQKTATAKELRKTDARQKILAGACAMDTMMKRDDFRELFQPLLDEYLVRTVDRKVFGLPPIALVKAENGEVKAAVFEDVFQSVMDEPAPVIARPHNSQSTDFRMR